MTKALRELAYILLGLALLLEQRGDDGGCAHCNYMEAIGCDSWVCHACSDPHDGPNPYPFVQNSGLKN